MAIAPPAARARPRVARAQRALGRVVHELTEAHPDREHAGRRELEVEHRHGLAFSRREAVCSGSWRERFEDPAAWPRVLRAEPFGFVEQARACAGFGPPEGEWQYPDRNNEIVTLKVEAMSNTYRTFVLVWLPRRELFKRRRVVATAAETRTAN